MARLTDDELARLLTAPVDVELTPRDGGPTVSLIDVLEELRDLRAEAQFMHEVIETLRENGIGGIAIRGRA